MGPGSRGAGRAGPDAGCAGAIRGSDPEPGRPDSPRFRRGHAAGRDADAGRKPTGEAIRVPARPRKTVTDPARRETVLVVEDHPVNRMLLERVLELEQLEVLTAGSLTEAARVLERTVPPVIVLDLQLPDGDGLDLVRDLKSDPAHLRLRNCGVHGGPVAHEEEMALLLGCAEYVTKPIDTRSFASVVCALMPTQIGQ